MFKIGARSEESRPAVVGTGFARPPSARRLSLAYEARRLATGVARIAKYRDSTFFRLKIVNVHVYSGNRFVLFFFDSRTYSHVCFGNEYS